MADVKQAVFVNNDRGVGVSVEGPHILQKPINLFLDPFGVAWCNLTVVPYADEVPGDFLYQPLSIVGVMDTLNILHDVIDLPAHISKGWQRAVAKGL